LRNSFHSATPWALQGRAVTGSSFGARDVEQLQADLYSKSGDPDDFSCEKNFSKLPLAFPSNRF
jgi:hypothetical protein